MIERRVRISLPGDMLTLLLAVDETEAGKYIPVLRGLAPGEKVVSSGAIILSANAT